MARISVGRVERPLFETQLPIQVGDVNYGGHLANDAVLRLCHEARMRWLAALGWRETDAGGAGLIMADAAVQYLAQGYHGDVLRIGMGAAEVGGSGFALLYELTRVSDGLTLARVQTGMVCFDYARGRVCRMPEALKRRLTGV